MTDVDDDDWEMDARRKAVHLRREEADPRFVDAWRYLESRAARASTGVDVRPRPGRQFLLAEIGPGWIIYPNTTEEGRLDRPGLVVEVFPSHYVDPDTGELVDTTGYRCLRLPFNPASPWTVLDADEIDTGTLGGVDRTMASAAARWLVRPLNLRQRRVQLNLAETEALHDAWRLAAATSG